jgi:hypothetical protein
MIKQHLRQKLNFVAELQTLQLCTQHLEVQQWAKHEHFSGSIVWKRHELCLCYLMVTWTAKITWWQWHKGMNMEHWCNDANREKLKYLKKNVLQCHLSTTNPTQIDLGFNLCLDGERQMSLYCSSPALSITNSQHPDQQNAQYCFLDIYIKISHVLTPRDHYQGIKSKQHRTEITSNFHIQ